MKNSVFIFLIVLSYPVFGQKFTKDLTVQLSVSNADLDSTYKKIARDTAALKKELKKSIQHNNPTAELYFLNKLGVYFRDKSNYAKAYNFHKKALDIATKTKNIEQIIISNNYLGVVYRREDEIMSAIEFHQRALELAETIHNPNETILRNIAIACNSLGNVYLTMNQLEDALSYFQRSLEIEKKINNQLGLAINYHNIGGIYEKKNKLDSAMINYRKSMFYNNKIHSDIGILICNNSIGTIYLKQKNPNQAEKFLKNTIAESEQLQDDFYTATSYINTGWLYFLQKNNKSKATLKKGLEISEKKKYITSKIDAQQLLSELYEQENKPDSALFYYKSYAAEKEKLNSENTIKSINELKNKYTLEKRKNEINKLKTDKEKMMIKLNRNNLIYSALLLFFVAAGGAYYFYSRQNQLRQDKKLLLMEQDLIHLQMNPHFIFNALNSIKSYIVKNDTENSVLYLNKFSKIFRNVLTGIQQKENSLQKELDIIENYVSIENMRFGGSIQFFVEVDESLDLNSIMVPSFMFQIFVENAIWHGLALKESPKELKLKIYSIHQNRLLIEISDNGIGREKSREVNNRKTNRKESQGLRISQRQLEHYYGKEYGLKIIDLKNENNSSGTLVQIEFPIKG